MSDIRFNQWLHQSGTGGVTQLSSGHVGIGTTNPLIPVHSGNNAVLNVGVVTANNIYAGTLNGTLALSDISGITGSFTSDLTVNGPNLDISDKIRHIGDTNTAIRFPANDTVSFETGGSEKFRIGSDGQIGLSGQNYGTAGQVLTSQGSGSAVQWATPSSGDYVKIQRGTNGYVASYVFDNLDVATYKFFDFNAAFVPGNDGEFPYFRFRTGGASGADVSGAHYSYGYGEAYPSNNATQGSQTGRTEVTLSGTLGYNTNNGEGLRINMRIMFADANDNGSSGQLSNFITYQYIRVDANGNPRHGHGSAIYNQNTTTYPTGFRIYMGSGGINANSFGLYGMKR